MTPAILLFDFLRISELNENMQNLSEKIQSLEKKELMTADDLKKNVETIDEINVHLKDYLTEIEVTVIEVTL